MTKIRIDSLLQALRERGLKVRAGRGGQYYAQCPAHDDKNPSLSVKDDGGYAVIHCHAGCEYGDIIGALGLNGEAANHDHPPTRRRGRPPKGYAGPPLRWLAEYCDLEPAWVEGDRHLGGEDGHVVFRFLYAGREVARKLRRAGTKEIHWEPVGGLTPPLWPIPETPGAHIVLCEGETDAIILRSRGVEAYAITKGAQAGIDDVLAKELHRKGVCTASVLFDADDVGRRGAEKVRKALDAAGIGVDVVDLTEYLSVSFGGKDVRDLWRGDKGAFARLLDRLRTPKPAGGGGGGIRRRFITGKELMEMDFPLPTWRVAGLLPEAGLTILAAEAKLGKTWLALQLSRAVMAGGEVLGRRVMNRGRVLYLAYEDGLARLRDRISAQEWESEALGGVVFMDGAGMDLTNPAARGDLANEVRREGYKLVVIDTLKAALRDGRIEENQAEFANTLYALREAVCGAGASLLIIHHHRKVRAGDVSIDMRGTSALSGAADMMLGLYRRDGKVFLDVRGRDLPTGDQRIQVRFSNEVYAWELSESREPGEAHKRIMAALQGGPLAAREIQDATHISKNTLYNILGELESWGWVRVDERHTGGRPARVYVSTASGTQRAPLAQAAISPEVVQTQQVVSPGQVDILPGEVEAPLAQLAIPPDEVQAPGGPAPETGGDMGPEGWSWSQQVRWAIEAQLGTGNRLLDQACSEALRGIDPKGPNGQVWAQVINAVQRAIRLPQRALVQLAILGGAPDTPEVSQVRARVESLFAESLRMARDVLALLEERQVELGRVYLRARVEAAPGKLWHGTRDILDKLKEAGFDDIAALTGDMIQPYDAYKARLGIYQAALGVWGRRKENPEGFNKVWPRMEQCLDMALGDKWRDLLKLPPNNLSHGQ